MRVGTPNVTGLRAMNAVNAMNGAEAPARPTQNPAAHRPEMGRVHFRWLVPLALSIMRASLAVLNHLQPTKQGAAAPPTAGLLLGALGGAQLVEGQRLVIARLGGQAQGALADDVALDLVSAAVNGRAGANSTISVTAPS